MDISCFDNKILIINNGMKSSLLKLINESDKLLNIKLITLSELKKKYFFDYDKEAIYYVCNNYNVIPEVAKIYLDNLYYVSDSKEEKIIFLNKLMNDLDSHNLLLRNNSFKDYIDNSDVVLFNLKYIDKFYNRIFDNIKSLLRYDIEDDNGIKPLVVCNNREEEIGYVSSKICELIKSGIDINNIKLSNVTSEYNYIIKNIFKMFNIKVNLNSDESIKGTRIVKCFKDNYDLGINECLEIVNKLVNTKEDNDIYKSLVNIINSYSFINDYSLVKDYIFNDIDNTKIKEKRYKNAVNIVDIENEIISENDYVFLINFTEGVIPHNHKDEDYLSDKIKQSLNLSMSYELNNNSLMSLKDAIKRVKNLIVTYPKNDIKDKLYMSSSYDENILRIEMSNISFEHSNLFNKTKLISLLDDNKKYGSISEELTILNNHYKNINYLSYDNKFKGIDPKELYDFLGHRLSLSYTSLNEYYGCSFKYYLDYILRIGGFEDTYDASLGTIFHGVLSKCFSDDFDFEECFLDERSKCKYEFTSSELYFLDKLKTDLKLIIETIQNQLKYTQFDKFMYEKEIKIEINKETNVTFKGFVDKIMYKETPYYTVVAIVDYKTGNPTLTLNNSVYGLDMQLPIYMYLIKNSNVIKNARIGGLYLQKILGNSKTIEDKVKDLKLQGYSNSDTDILEIVDSSYRDSNVIKGLKIKNDGTFYFFFIVISDDEIDYLCNIVNDKINEASNKILNGEFDINPKVIKNINKGCMYCKYNDICYMRNEDIVNLKEVSNLFGGEDYE